MELRDKLQLSLICTLAVALLLSIGWISYEKYSHSKEVVKLQNQIAEKDKTIEIQKGVYTRLSIQTQEINLLLSKKDVEIKNMLDQIKKQKEQLLSATSAVLMWKKAYEGIASATGTTVTNNGKVRERVDFNKDFGYIGVEGWTMTSPAEAWVKVSQKRPLKLTVSLVQGIDKSWKSYVTSSEDNVGVDIQVASVNPQVFKPKWYEKIGVAVDIGAGMNQAGLGALFGFGLNYQIGQFTVGPHAWFGINKSVDKYAGITFEWRPFQKK